MAGQSTAGAAPRIAIATDFPGGNIAVVRNEAATVRIEPDLRGGRSWFYWCFEAKADRPGRVTFVLPDAMPTFEGPPVGMQGPAVSLDQGKTWKWAGADGVVGGTFHYDFTAANQAVRFSSTIPYLHSDLAAFLKENESNAHLSVGILTHSRKGRDVELLQIGKPRPGVKAVLFTARHHAGESIANFVLEGFIKTAISDTPAGREFRRNYLLYVVPFVDKDGVEDGDQGKGRVPHDHNRDYGEGSIFPEIVAIQKLAGEKNIQLLQDYHCPTLRMQEHQVLYFVGARQAPPNNERHVTEFARRIKENLPPDSPSGPVVLLQDRQPVTAGGNCNRWFAFREGAIMASTLEIPFAPPGTIMTAARCREMGAAMLKAWVEARFLEPVR